MKPDFRGPLTPKLGVNLLEYKKKKGWGWVRGEFSSEEFREFCFEVGTGVFLINTSFGISRYRLVN